MGEAGVKSVHVVQPSQPRACPPPPVRRGLGKWRRARAGAGGGRCRTWGACLRRELSPRPSAEVGADVPGCPARGTQRPGPAKTMAFMVKTMVGGQLKNLTGSLGGGEDKGDGDKSAAEAQGMSREEYEEYQKQLVEEK